ncbi:hypothetical protein [Marinicella gelatinilytica]|uniref:hypothetical protein n=1 Tax=Marinicella gelatinilytica TaxID=2996017 RepID=UPI002260A2ED|nr:hypothetical protein [Marinicella gelatinilytica]MCX7545538.1 hypothetical protein [Marinicella gelatinilytica]
MKLFLSLFVVLLSVNQASQATPLTSPSAVPIMDLGHWRGDIAARIYPNFYRQLNISPTAEFPQAVSFAGAKYYFSQERLNHLGDLMDGKNYFFTFDYEKSFIKPASFSDNLFEIDQLLFTDREQYSRRIFAPGVAFQLSEQSQFNFAVLFAQQNYSDINFLASPILTYGQLDMYPVSYTETSNGLGVNLGLEHSLNRWLSFETSYQSKIDMDGFSQLLGVQADPADFDIPASIDVAFNLQITAQDSFQFIARHNYYSDVNAFVSRSYPDIFLSFLNDMESPEFKWADQTVFAVGYNHTFKQGTQFNIEYSGRQQPPATDADLTTILKAISADYSVRIGMTTHILGGQLDLYASYAPQPLNFGRTDFGRVSSAFEGRHTEAVLSWLKTF